MTEMKGLKTLLAQLEKMGESLQGEDIQPILRNAAAPIVSAMQGKVRRKTGRLANSIKVLPFNPKFPYSVIIGPDFNANSDIKGTMTLIALTAIQEYGAKERYPKKTKKKGGNFRRVLIDGEWRTMSMSAPLATLIRWHGARTSREQSRPLRL